MMYGLRSKKKQTLLKTFRLPISDAFDKYFEPFIVNSVCVFARPRFIKTILSLIY
jgi:hypothetical protein